MLLIFLSRAASSLFTGLFGSLRFFSLGTSPARCWRWPTGAGTSGLSEFFGTVDDPPCANASGPPIRTSSAIDRIIFRILVLPFETHFIASAGERRYQRNSGVPGRHSLAPFAGQPWCQVTRFPPPPAPQRS